jgi:hypothetical protein
MPEPTPPQPLADDVEFDPAELADPIASVTALELSSRFVRLCLRWSEPMIADLAAREATLRKPGGAELSKRLLAERFHRRIEPEVFELLRRCIPLAQAAAALEAVEELLRARFADVAGTAADHLLTHDRDVALQMTAVAITMAGREIRTGAAQIIATHREEV